MFKYSVNTAVVDYDRVLAHMMEAILTVMYGACSHRCQLHWSTCFDLQSKLLYYQITIHNLDCCFCGAFYQWCCFEDLFSWKLEWVSSSYLPSSCLNSQNTKWELTNHMGISDTSHFSLWQTGLTVFAQEISTENHCYTTDTSVLDLCFPKGTERYIFNLTMASLWANVVLQGGRMYCTCI